MKKVECSKCGTILKENELISHGKFECCPKCGCALFKIVKSRM